MFVSRDNTYGDHSPLGSSSQVFLLLWLDQIPLLRSFSSIILALPLPIWKPQEELILYSGNSLTVSGDFTDEYIKHFR